MTPETDPLDAYLDRLVSAARLADPSAGQVRRELRAHLRELAEQFRRDGMTGVEAAAAATAEFGDPLVIGRAIAESRRPPVLRMVSGWSRALQPLLPRYAPAAAVMALAAGWWVWSGGGAAGRSSAVLESDRVPASPRPACRSVVAGLTADPAPPPAPPLVALPPLAEPPADAPPSDTIARQEPAAPPDREPPEPAEQPEPAAEPTPSLAEIGGRDAGGANAESGARSPSAAERAAAGMLLKLLLERARNGDGRP
jgi:hypothetical protein